MPAAAFRPETIHPSLWRASQLARGGAACVETGHAALSAELPGGGWPAGRLIELLLPRPGIGELRLLLPMLRQCAPPRDAGAGGRGPPAAARAGRPSAVRDGDVRRSVLLIQPPHVLQPLALSWWGVDPDRLILLRAPRPADACWAAEQALQAATCRLVLLWPQAGPRAGVRPDTLRRLNLAAQAGSTLFFMFRPAREADQSSPAPLRLALAPASGGVQVTFVKRRGPRRDEPLFVPLRPSPVLLDHDVRLDRRVSAAFSPTAGAANSAFGAAADAGRLARA
ncbi:MAG TPA: cell division protein [Castellaniella sp.]|nr:cell division protein [Castellaniella sp.]